MLAKYRVSYSSYEGAPKSADKEKDLAHIKNAGYTDKGFVWNAWAKGYRLGTIASSDHGSTHISYALVYTDDTSRKGIVEAIRKRHTYGTTDNIILEYRMGNHFMGDEFTTDEIPVISVKVRGTRVVSQIDIIKGNTFIYTSNPEKREVEFTYKDTRLEPGTSYYYVRVQQEDGQIAWSSPIWVNFRK